MGMECLQKQSIPNPLNQKSKQKNGEEKAVRSNPPILKGAGHGLG
jgi:hypothetical protein